MKKDNLNVSADKLALGAMIQFDAYCDVLLCNMNFLASEIEQYKSIMESELFFNCIHKIEGIKDDIIFLQDVLNIILKSKYNMFDFIYKYNS